MTHTYDILFAATFTVALLLTFRGRIRIRATAIALGLAAAATLVTLAPLVGDLLHAGGERTARNPVFLGDWTASFHYWVVDLRRYMLFGSPAPGTSIQLPNSLGIHLALWLTVPCLLASPLVFFLPRLHWGRPWLITWATWTAIGIWTSASSSHLADSLAHLWYGNVARLRDMVFVVYTMPAVAGACVIGTLVQLAWTKLPEDRSPRWVAGPVLPTAAALLLVVPLLGLGSLPGPRRDLNNRLTRLTPTSAAYPRVFAWLADHTPKDQVIAYNRNVEFIPWAFGDYGVGALFGIFALVPSSRQNEADRWLAWSWLVDQRGIATQGCLVDKFRIRYVVVGRKRVPGRYPAAYLHPDIAQSPYVDLVHEDQGVQVYQVNDAGRACATAG